MKNFDFYLCLNFLNILLSLFIYGIIICSFIVLYIAENNFVLICPIILCILAKSLCLYILFTMIEKIFPKSILNKVAKELRTKANRKKQTLLLSFGYDVIIIICLTLSDLKDDSFEWLIIPAYEIISLGGICMFYIGLFSIWKIQDKLKQKSQLQDTNTSCKEGINE